MGAKERRQWPREKFKEPVLAVIHGEIGPNLSHRINYPIYVRVQDYSERGFLIDTPFPVEKNALLDFSLYNFPKDQWTGQVQRVAWVRKTTDKREHEAGLESVENEEFYESILLSKSDHGRQTLNDTAFLLHTRLLRAIPRTAIWPLLNCMESGETEAGKKIISQGDIGDKLFIIQDGSCAVMVESGGEPHQVARVNQGDVVGEMAVITGERRYASVVADSETKWWRISKNDFEEVSAHHNELLMFLTELVSKRLEESSFTADRTIGKYLIKSKLGHGAWGIIYEGIHSSLNKVVAVKMLKHQMAMDEDFSKKFFNEAKLIAMLNHQNIVHVYDIEKRYKTLFIVMEYLEGNSLETLLKQRGSLSSAETVNILMQICSGMAYAHDKGIVHQDIKPANIQVLPGNQVKILDFGLACPIGSENFDMDGTAYYMSPEQIESEPVDARTDIYNLGITAYEMVTGRRPYPEDDLMTLLDMHVEEDIPDPTLLVLDLAKELRGFIVKACARDPRDRYQNMNEAIAAIEPYYHEAFAEDRETRGRRRMASLLFIYPDAQDNAMNRLFEEFCSRAEELGAAVRASEYKDI
jgi:CRP-like cAMP-binding protein